MLFRNLAVFGLAALIYTTPVFTTPVIAHEFWVEPQEYQVENGGKLLANLRNGQKFKGSKLAYFDSNIARFDTYLNGDIAPVTGRMGDIPALDMVVDGDGLLVIVHQTTPSTLKYATWEKFQAFADHKDFTNMRARHDARGLPEADFSETYTRHVKTLVGIGTSQGQDLNTGLETEFIALANPYTDDVSLGFPVQLLYQGAPRSDAQIELFDRAPDGSVTIHLYQTDASGQATVQVTSGHTYLLDAVVLRDAAETDQSVWETLWAALSFAVP